MAFITVVSGGAQPVFATDVLNGNPAQTANLANAAVTNFQGPKLDFFTVTFTGALTTTQLNTAVQTIQQLCTIYMYEYTDDTNDTLAIAVYPVGAWTTATLDTALTAAVEAVTVAASATFTG